MLFYFLALVAKEIMKAENSGIDLKAEQKAVLSPGHLSVCAGTEGLERLGVTLRLLRAPLVVASSSGSSSTLCG